MKRKYPEDPEEQETFRQTDPGMFSATTRWSTMVRPRRRTPRRRSPSPPNGATPLYDD